MRSPDVLSRSLDPVAAASADSFVGVLDAHRPVGLVSDLAFATDIDEAFQRLYAAGAANDVEAALDAALDIISITSGIVGISQHLRAVMGRPDRA